MLYIVGESPFVDRYHVVVRSLLTRCVSSAQTGFDDRLADLADEHHIQIFESTCSSIFFAMSNHEKMAK